MFRAAMGHFLVHFLGYSLEMSKERRRGYSWYPLRRSVFFAACSHHLCHEITHLFGSTFLHLPRDMGVSAEREACVEVTEHTGHSFHVYAVLERQCRECMSQVVKSQMLQPCVFQNFLVDVDHRVRVVHLARFR